jgi:hypothetical protein
VSYLANWKRRDRLPSPVELAGRVGETTREVYTYRVTGSTITMINSETRVLPTDRPPGDKPMPPEMRARIDTMPHRLGKGHGDGAPEAKHGHDRLCWVSQ